jgi:hypothetical protein
LAGLATGASSAIPGRETAVVKKSEDGFKTSVEKKLSEPFNRLENWAGSRFSKSSSFKTSAAFRLADDLFEIAVHIAYQNIFSIRG